MDGLGSVAADLLENIQCEAAPETNQTDFSGGNVEVTVAALFLVVAIAKAVVSGVLLHRVDKERVPMITPWIVYHIMETAIKGTVMLLMIGLTSYNGPIGIWFILLLIGLFFIGIPVYFQWELNKLQKKLIAVSMAPTI